MGIKIINIEQWTQSPTGALQIYNPAFRHMTANKAIESAKVETEYLPYGYNVVFFCQNLGTMYLYNNL